MALKSLLPALLLLVSCVAGPASAASLLGPVTDDSVAPLIEALTSAPRGGTVNILFDSPGGSVGAGMDLLEQMRAAKRRNVKIVCLVDGTAASMTAVLFQACDVRGMTKGSVLLFHTCSVSDVGGNVAELARVIQYMNEVNKMLAIVASAHMNITLAEYEARVAGKDWILSPAEAVAVGASDVVVP